MKTKSLIAALLLAASSAFAQVPSYVPTNGLVGWWPFNGNANDESGNGNNGTVNGATLTSDRNSNANAAYNFDGNGDFISCPNTTSINPTYMTFSFWSCLDISNLAYPSGFAITKGCENPYGSSNGFSYRAYYSSQDTMWVVDNVNSNLNRSFALSGTNYQINDWVNIVMTYNGVAVKLYINGIFVDDSIQTGNIIASNGDLLFGARRIGQSCNVQNFFKGKIDDIGIWSRALSQQEIVTLYNSQSCTGNITADGPTTFCAGNYVNLTSDVVGGTYQWKKNGVNITTNGTSRTYKATATGSYTCVATCNGTALTSNAIQATSQTNAAVTLSASGATSFCAGDSITLNATNLGSGYSVQWYRTNISMQGATNYSVVVKQPGTYKTVTKNLANGCSRISSGSIITAVNCRMSNPANISVEPVSDEITSTKLGNSTETAMHLFPNPNAGSFTLEYDGIEADFEVQVINTMGQVIYNDIIPSNDNHLKTTINLGDNMQKGIYVVRIINGEEVHESKVMLQ